MNHICATIWNVQSLFNHCGCICTLTEEGKWVETRPLGLQGLQIRHRLKCAYLAFTGKCDLISWPNNQ